MSLSKQLAKYMAETSYEDMSKEEIEFTKVCVLDWLGSALAGYQKEPIQMIAEMVRESGGNPQATLITGGKSSALQAALVNGAASHIVELDDIHKASIIHAGTVVIPAALAVAEWKRKSGKELIAAIAIGYEVCYRIGEAVSPSHYYYFHNTATCGTFGAAAAVAKLLDLNEEQMVHTLGSAGTQAAGLWEFIEDGAMSKQLHPGKAAMNGVISALLAEKGFTGASKILEGDRGFFKAMASEYDESKITQNLGKGYKIVENSFKIHASCRHTHPAIDLVLEVVKEHQPKLADINKIKIRGYRAVREITDNPNPDTIYASKFSSQFCTALAFKVGSAGLYDFTEQNLHDPEIRDLMKRIEVVVDEQVDNAYPEEWGTILEVELASGETILKSTKYPKGDPENPVTTEELVDKFKRMAQHIPANLVDSFVERVLSLEQLDDAANLFPEEVVSGL